MAGALLGGLLSWSMWSALDGQLYPSALLMSLLGAVFVLVLWPCVVYARSFRVPVQRVP
jgi:uncharacterized membrane protein YeaQ/YmgE (transglycosylase-associated protein family)